MMSGSREGDEDLSVLSDPAELPGLSTELARDEWEGLGD
jgi:hypothetical protein